MKFIKLRHGKDETRTYTVNIDNIGCIETFVNDNETVSTWVYLKNLGYEPLYVKETEGEISGILEQHERMKRLANLIR